MKSRELFGKKLLDIQERERQIGTPDEEQVLVKVRACGVCGTDVNFVYGGTGLSGHYSFWDPHLAREYGMSHEEWRKANPRLISFRPISTVQMAITDMSGALPFVPPKAYTTASTTTMNADFRSLWNDGRGLPRLEVPS
jgi:hypothetical protein